MKITYLSHGQNETGGYYHEKMFCETLSDVANNCDICYKEIRFKRNFKGIWGWVLLFLKAFFAAKGETIVTVARLAWPVYFRYFFNKNRIIVVLHNYDPRDNKPKLYFYLLKRFFKVANSRKDKISLVVVAEYWKNNLSTNLNFKGNVFLFPNFFDNAKLHFYRDVVHKKSNLIHLGQWNDKIDKKLYRIFIHALEHAGLVCYFSDNQGTVIHDFPVTQFNTHEAYLKQMALCKCTVILNKIEEGWNRVAHESMLVGTPVVSNGVAGLSELINMGNGHIIHTVEEAIDLCLNDRLNTIDYKALEKFNISNKNTFVQPILHWLEA